MPLVLLAMDTPKKTTVIDFKQARSERIHEIHDKRLHEVHAAFEKAFPLVKPKVAKKKAKKNKAKKKT